MPYRPHVRRLRLHDTHILIRRHRFSIHPIQRCSSRRCDSLQKHLRRHGNPPHHEYRSQHGNDTRRRQQERRPHVPHLCNPRRGCWHHSTSGLGIPSRHRLEFTRRRHRTMHTLQHAAPTTRAAICEKMTKLHKLDTSRSPAQIGEWGFFLQARHPLGPTPPFFFCATAPKSHGPSSHSRLGVITSIAHFL